MSEPREFYTGLVAELYGALRSTTFPPEPYAQLIAEHGEPALELGCGDGVPLLDLRARGLDVDGLDSSPDMIARLHERARERGLEVRAWVADMETMRTARRYRTVFLAGPTFNLLPDDDAMGRALGSVRRALDPARESRAVVPLFVPEPVEAGEIGRTTRTESNGVVLSVTITRARRDDEQRTQTLTLRYTRTTTDRTESVDRDWVIHWIGIEAFGRLAADSGLCVVRAPSAIGAEPQDVVLSLA